MLLLNVVDIGNIWVGSAQKSQCCGLRQYVPVLKMVNVMVCCRKSLREAAERLADKYEDAKYRQEAIMNRFIFIWK